MNDIAFRYPGLFWLALAAIPLLLLYLLKLKRPHLEIPSLVLWRQVLQDARINSPFQKFKRNILLLLQLLALLFLVLAAAQPFLRGDARDDAQRELWLVDVSASTAAKDPRTGRSALQDLQQVLLRRIDGLRPGEQRAILRFDNAAAEHCAFTDKPHVLRDAVRSLRSHDVPSDPVPVLRMAAALSRRTHLHAVRMFSDGNVPASLQFDLPFALQLEVPETTPPPNGGITALSARRSTLDGWDVLARVEHNLDTDASFRLQWYLDDAMIDEQVLTLAPHTDEQAMVFVAASNQVLRAQLVPLQNDALRSDDQASIVLPTPRPVRVLLDEGLPHFARALRVTPGITRLPDSENTADLQITRLRDALPQVPVAMHVGVLPDALTNHLYEVNQPGTIIDWRRDHPLLLHVDLDEQHFFGGAAYRVGSSDADLEENGFRVLVHSASAPLLLEQPLGERVAYWWLIRPQNSTLPHRVAFPVMVANLSHLTANRLGLRQVEAYRTGALPAQTLPPDAPYTLRRPDGTERKDRARPDGRVEGLSALQSGLYALRTATETRWLPVALLDSRETLLDRSGALSVNEVKVQAEARTAREEVPLWRALVWLMILLLLIEWRAAHRPRRGIPLRRP